MIVIPPLDILNNRDTLLISSSVTEGGYSDPPEWVRTDVHTIGNRVYMASNSTSAGMIYESLITHTNSPTPDTDIYATVPKWAQVGYVNKWNMFDTLRNTTTVSDVDIEFVIRPGARIDTMAFLGLVNITQVDIEAVDSFGIVIYPNTSFIPTGESLVVQNLPLNSNATFTITLIGTGVRTIGAFVCGKAKYIGDSQTNIQLSTLNFSVVERDMFGNSTVVSRRSVPKINKTLFLRSEFVADVLRTKESLNAIPVLWVSLDPTLIPEYYESLIILGFYRTFTVTMSSTLHAIINLELEEI